MANKSTAERNIDITSAARMFATQTRDAGEIAKALDTSIRTIHRYAETEKWDEVLRILGYKGERNFRVKKAGRPRGTTKNANK